MKRNLPKKLLSLLLSGMLVFTGLDVTTVRAAEPSAAVEPAAETTSSESQTVAETASSASQNETTTESQAVTESAADESQATAESSSEEPQTAMESDADEPQTTPESGADESQTANESDDAQSQTATDSETEESQSESETETETLEENTEEELPSFSLFEVNPLYADLIDTPQAEEEFEGKALLAEPREEATCQTLEEAAAHLREKMIVREGTVVINMPSKVLLGYNFNTFFNAVFEAAFEYSDACSGQEGDALRWATKTRGIDGTSPDNQNYRLVFTITYHSTAAQEEELTAAVNAALSELNLDGKSDYEKVRAIHDYICDHVDYDYSLKKYSAYDALCTGTAVCQGYSTVCAKMQGSQFVSFPVQEMAARTAGISSGSATAQGQPDSTTMWTVHGTAWTARRTTPIS